ncbi:hypothetical protein KW799_01550 [Candidatus Parcubacteria bacterium]|nr:hypothetical protein [Candidatus Parcubacteria bacterium]
MFFEVKRSEDGTTLFVRDGKDTPWTLPGGVPERDYRNYTAFAQESLESVYDGCSILSVDEKMVLESGLMRCSVFACSIIGVPREAMLYRMRFFDIQNVTSYMVPSGMSRVIEALQKLNRPP